MIGGRRPDWGTDWGEAAEMPADALRADSDAAAAEIAAAARCDNRPAPAVVLTGGDLARTLGITSGHQPSASRPAGAFACRGLRVLADVGSVVADGREHWFAAHLVARRSWWRGRLLAVANASFIGDWNIAPRAHPGDGRLDVLDACPAPRVRWAAWRRLRSGTHVPHPAIAQRRVRRAHITLDPTLDLFCDGRDIGRAKSLAIEVRPEALEVWL